MIIRYIDLDPSNNENLVSIVKGTFPNIQDNKPLDRNKAVFQLGWDSLVVFKDTGKEYNILKNMYYYKEPKFAEIPSDWQRPFSQIVTRGISSCTFVYIRANTFQLMLHLDRSTIRYNFCSIMQEIKALRDRCVSEEIQIFCSIYDLSKPDEEAPSMQLCNAIKKLFDPESFPELQFAIHDRHANGDPVHIEIGVAYTGDTSGAKHVIFGDYYHIAFGKEIKVTSKKEFQTADVKELKRF